MHASARALLLTLLFATALQATPPLSEEVLRQRREARARYERNVAQMTQRSEQRWKELQAKQKRINQKMYEDYQRQLAARRPSTQLPPFDPASAPPPADCLYSFIAAAKAASSMEQLLPYLPVDEQVVLKERQKQYDPKVAAQNRAWHKQQNPDIDEESLTFLSNPPYVNELNHNKSIANRILEVLEVKVEGNKALIEVSTTSGAVVNGVRYPYGTAEVELVGEAGFWKVHSYNDSNVVYLKPPQSR